MSQAAADSPTANIDWSTISTNIECPLCLYNLRGLVEPRCPECGFQFEWPELFDPQRQRHRYLFEHHPERNLWSFFRTLLGGLRPRRFWAVLRPTQVVRLRRLIIYWILWTCLLSLLPISQLLRVGADLAQSNALSRAIILKRNPNVYRIAGAQQYIDARYPLPPSATFFGQIPKELDAPLLRQLGVEWGTILIWPFLTLAALMIFQTSMRRAKIRPAHVLRCVIYCADASVSYAVLTLLTICGLILWAFFNNGLVGPEPLGVWLIILLWLARIDRLSVAYHKYLQFDHPFLTVLASQIIVLLAIACLLFWGGRMLQLDAFG